MQYLLKIDYFNNDPNAKKQNKSDYIASITSIAPILNGNVSTYMFGWSAQQENFIPWHQKGTLNDLWFVYGCKIFSIVSNFMSPGQT